VLKDHIRQQLENIRYLNTKHWHFMGSDGIREEYFYELSYSNQ
jgi:hypothetical protein